MTQMSEQRIETTPTPRANPATAGGRDRVARALHGVYAIRTLLFAVMFTGCFLPPSYQVDNTDAALNSAPAILSVRANDTELPEFSTVVFEQGQNAGEINLTLWDTDRDDTLYVKIYVDYNIPEPTPARTGCESSASTVQRTTRCDMAGVCTLADVSANATRVMSIVVFDREVLDFGLPLYQHMPEGGLSTSRTYFLKCVEAQQT
jgi:hypothetical protein